MTHMLLYVISFAWSIKYKYRVFVPVYIYIYIRNASASSLETREISNHAYSRALFPFFFFPTSRRWIMLLHLEDSCCVFLMYRLNNLAQRAICRSKCETLAWKHRRCGNVAIPRVAYVYTRSLDIILPTTTHIGIEFTENRFTKLVKPLVNIVI